MTPSKLQRHVLKSLAVSGLAATLGFAVPSTDASAQTQQFVSIGTGGVTGVYYPTGGAICRLINKGRRDHGIRCSVESTDGSEFNINTIRAQELEFGVAQADLQYHAYNGTANFEDQGAFTGLRSVFAVHPEPFTVLARADAGITTFEDLKGKRVNIGPPGSGGRNTTLQLLDAMGWTLDDFVLASELKATEQGQALCDNKLDAIVYVVGHPNGSIQEATTACESNLVAVNSPAAMAMVDDTPYFGMRQIPGGMYRQNPDDVDTFGVRATFVTSTDVSEDVVYTLVKSVFDNFTEFKRLHPVFEQLSEQDMVSDGLFAPLHDGASRYYRERGWIE